MSALGQEPPFRPDRPKGRFAPKAVIRMGVLLHGYIGYALSSRSRKPKTFYKRELGVEPSCMLITLGELQAHLWQGSPSSSSKMRGTLTHIHKVEVLRRNSGALKSYSRTIGRQIINRAICGLGAI
jgi:hypothetical protein